MKRSAWVRCGGAIAAALLSAGSAAAQPVEDDLAVVKKAVSASPSPQQPQELEAKAASAAPRKDGKPAPQWLKVRVVDKGTKKGKVSVNLPLALVRAVGGWPIDFRCGRAGKEDKRCTLKMAEALEALESGQDLVEIDDEEATVRVWVE